MKIKHQPYHWVLVVLALIAFLLTFGEAHGQSGAAAVFEGRPAMAGAQGGLGAQAGMPQGGIGVQGNEVAERSLRPNKPTGLDNMQQARRDDSADVVTAAETTESTPPAPAPQVRKEFAPARDQSLAKDQRSAKKKAVRGAKNTVKRARHGTSEPETHASATR